MPAAVRSRLDAKWSGRPASYVPRTRHRLPGGTPQFTNRPFLETSPYLLQHAHNPVNWFPWGDEAFEEARQRGVPVLLSVGYSTCHWCHVMEEESFEDEEIARVMNESYVSIKVDREERPDLDGIYMTAVQMLTGRGGWPMTVWLTADRKPYFGGTYFPARDGDRGSSIGFLTMLRRFSSAHAAQPERIAQASEQLASALRQHLLGAAASRGLPGAEALSGARSALQSSFDSREGGVAGAPKFPSSMPVRLLLRLHRRTGDPELLKMRVCCEPSRRASPARPWDSRRCYWRWTSTSTRRRRSSWWREAVSTRRRRCSSRCAAPLCPTGSSCWVSRGRSSRGSRRLSRSSGTR
ncbi:MAG: thioredoxin domain-containing protein [Candidatus Wallbacteria bacterium]|nr:thioredoxin domain-containing protein [Candidatus Wallbacteria bacterium]